MPAVREAKGRDKPYKPFDGGGLFLLVTPSGRKGWRLKCRIRGEEKLLSWRFWIGDHPSVVEDGQPDGRFI